jgi:hypothetical protein
MSMTCTKIGICGLSCRLCPRFYTEGESRCGGCKTESRISIGCPFITCALKKRGIEFCWQCGDAGSCEKWRHHREYGRRYDTFVCYRKLEENIGFIRTNGVELFDSVQEKRAGLLLEMLRGFNEGRSKSYYCIAATVLELDELKNAVETAEKSSVGLDSKGKSRRLHAVLDAVAEKRGYSLRLRKYTAEA